MSWVLYFVALMVGIITTLCATPLLMALGGISFFGLGTAILEKNAGFDNIAISFIGLLWAWAGFQGLIGYWYWVEIIGNKMLAVDIKELKSIRRQGVWGVLALLPISHGFSWFAIPLFCFIAYIFWDLKQKLAKLRHLT